MPKTKATTNKKVTAATAAKAMPAKKPTKRRRRVAKVSPAVRRPRTSRAAACQPTTSRDRDGQEELARQRQLILLSLVFGPTGVDQIYQLTSIDKRKIARRLQGFIEKGTVAKVPRGRYTSYSLADKNGVATPSPVVS